MNRYFRLIPFVVVLGIVSFLLIMPIRAQEPSEPAPIYLPIVAKEQIYAPPLVIYGKIDGYNAFTSNRILTLKFFDGIQTTSVMTTTTYDINRADGGYYRFEDIPRPAVRGLYRVSYYRHTCCDLAAWHSFWIDSAFATGDVAGGNFSIAAHTRLGPRDGIRITPDVELLWNYRRPQVDDYVDNYVVRIYDANGNLVHQSPDLGYLKGYILGTLPEGMTYNTPYFWEVMIQQPDGGIGISNEHRWQMTFIAESALERLGGSSSCTILGRSLTECDFDWSLVDGAAGYYFQAPQMVNCSTIIPTAGPPIRCGGFCGQEYEWRVKAYNATEEGPWYVGEARGSCTGNRKAVIKEQNGNPIRVGVDYGRGRKHRPERADLVAVRRGAALWR